MSEEIYDVMIVGCGPAGNTLAYKLSNDGFRVLLIDKAILPRTKVCGGGISRKTAQAIGIDFTGVVEREITGAFLTYRNEDAIHKLMPGIGSVVNRADFDHFLTDCAARRGAVVRDGVEFHGYIECGEYVKVATSGGEYRARILVGADGVHSKVRRCFAPNCRPMLGHAIDAIVVPAHDALERLGDNTIFDFGAIPGGYGWIFPRKESINVGLFKINNRNNNKNMRKLLDEFIARNKVFDNYRSIDIKGYSIPLKPVARRLTRRNVMLIGDAAGFGESFYGEGIYYAVWSARLAFDAISDFVRHGKPLGSYDKKTGAIRRELFFSRLTARFFYSAPRFGYYRMVKNKWVNYYFSQVIWGNVSQTRCFIETLCLFPLWMFFSRYPAIKDSKLF